MFRSKAHQNTIVILLTIILSGIHLTGCSKGENERKSRYIDENTPWYECETITFNTDDIGTYDNAELFYADSDIQMFHRFMDPDTDQYCNILCISDKDGNVTSVDMQELFSDSEDTRVYNCFREEDEHYLLIRNTNKGEEHSCIYRLSEDDEPLEFCFEIQGDEDHPGMYADKVVFRDNRYYTHCLYLDGYKYKERFVVLDEQGNELYGSDVDEEILMWTLSGNNELLYVDFTHDSVEVRINAYRFNPESGSEAKLNIDPIVLERYCLGTIQDDGCIWLTNNDLTLTKLDLDTGDETMVLDYNNSNAGLSDMVEGAIMHCDDSTIVVAKNTFYPSEPMNLKLYILRKADSNPNAGKQIVTAATYYLISPVEANAILENNRSDTDIYIYLTMDYSWVTFTDYETSEDGTVSIYNKNLALMAKLKNDIRAGDGPDILLDFGEYATLYCDDYLYDLSEIINDPERFHREDYFSNLFDAYAVDGKMYQIPVSVEVSGIYAYADSNSETGKGFSFDEYSDYIENYCTGIDPLADNYGRDLCMEYLFKSNYKALYDEDGRIDLDNDTFRGICEYCRTASGNNSSYARIDGAEYVGFFRVHYDFSRKLISADRKLYGLPSYDGENGPTAHCNESVAITSCASDPDGLFDFVSTMLSYDVQITNISYNPINREAFEYYAEDAIEYSNDYIMTMSGRADYNGEELIDEYVSYLESADTCYIADEYSLLILKEELESYYAGQKPLDEVIEIAQSRINNMIEENR